jgi:DNA-binding transcriptional regulator YhcF (GntR family)
MYKHYYHNILNCQELFFEAMDLQSHILIVIFVLLQLRRTHINRIPLYKQIYEYLLENIKSGTWHADKPIPSENELSRQFKVSRITIKQALDMLVEKGIVYRIQGRGTFISTDQSGEPVIFRAGDFNATSQALRAGRFIGISLHAKQYVHGEYAKLNRERCC